MSSVTPVSRHLRTLNRRRDTSGTVDPLNYMFQAPELEVIYPGVEVDAGTILAYHAAHDSVNSAHFPYRSFADDVPETFNHRFYYFHNRASIESTVFDLYDETYTWTDPVNAVTYNNTGRPLYKMLLFGNVHRLTIIHWLRVGKAAGMEYAVDLSRTRVLFDRLYTPFAKRQAHRVFSYILNTTDPFIQAYYFDDVITDQEIEDLFKVVTAAHALEKVQLLIDNDDVSRHIVSLAMNHRGDYTSPVSNVFDGPLSIEGIEVALNAHPTAMNMVTNVGTELTLQISSHLNILYPLNLSILSFGFRSLTQLSTIGAGVFTLTAPAIRLLGNLSIVSSSLSLEGSTDLVVTNPVIASSLPSNILTIADTLNIADVGCASLTVIDSIVGTRVQGTNLNCDTLVCIPTVSMADITCATLNSATGASITELNTVEIEYLQPNPAQLVTATTTLSTFGDRVVELTPSISGGVASLPTATDIDLVVVVNTSGLHSYTVGSHLLHPRTISLFRGDGSRYINDQPLIGLPLSFTTLTTPLLSTGDMAILGSPTLDLTSATHSAPSAIITAATVTTSMSISQVMTTTTPMLSSVYIQASDIYVSQLNTFIPSPLSSTLTSRPYLEYTDDTQDVTMTWPATDDAGLATGYAMEIVVRNSTPGRLIIMQGSGNTTYHAPTPYVYQTSTIKHLMVKKGDGSFSVYALDA